MSKWDLPEPKKPEIHTVGVRIVGVLLQQRCDSLRGVVGEDVLLDLDAKVVDIVGLDDTLDGAGDVPRKISFSFIGSCFLVEDALRAVEGVVFELTEQDQR